MAVFIESSGHADAETMSSMNEAAKEATEPEEVPEVTGGTQAETEGHLEKEILGTQDPEVADAIPFEEPSIMADPFHVTSERRKALVVAISGFTSQQPKYQNAQTFTNIVDNYAVNKQGTVTVLSNEASMTESIFNLFV